MSNPDLGLRLYVGRFAPSPTGPLHFGSLVAATASFLDAQASGGQWLVRMEDLDRERTQAGAADGILRDLERFGFTWTGPVLYQSTRNAAYRAALETLERAGLVYPCACSRKEIADSMVRPAGPFARSNNAAADAGPRYPGTCRHGVRTGRAPTSWRLRASQETIHFTDRVQGGYAQNLADAVGDFVVKRPPQAFAYQLAVVADDAAQNITHVVRGADLLDSTPRQIYLQQLLGLNTPSYAHIPVAADAGGNKLSKQTGATALDALHPQEELYRTLQFLGQQPPTE